MSVAGATFTSAPGAVEDLGVRDQVRLPVFLAILAALLTLTPLVQGKLQLLDVVCLLAAPLTLRSLRRSRTVLVLSLSVLFWAVGQTLSDEVNGLGLRLSMQSVTAVTVLGITPVIILLARNNFRRVRVLVIGVAVGLVLQLVLVEHVPLTSPAGWKFGLNGPVAVALLALTDLSWRRGSRLPSILALGAISALGVATDHRHLAGIAALTAMLLLIPRRGQKHPKTISVVAGLALLLSVLSGAFIQAAEAGVLGERSDGQIQQFGSKPQSILVNIRPEPFQELYLYSVRPIFGWGSLPQLDSESYAGSKQFLQDIGVAREDLDDLWLTLEVPGVSAHSQATDSMARAGLFAIPFWLLLLGLALKTGIESIRLRSSPLAVLWTILVIWDAIFSPLTGLSHIELSAYLALAVTGLTHKGTGASSV